MVPSGDAARAEGVLIASAVQHLPSLEVAARLLLRAEGVASSRIEAINAPADLVAVADVDHSVGGPAAWVADNLRAVDAALTHEGPLTTEDLWAWHRILMSSADLDDTTRDHGGTASGGWADPRRTAPLMSPHPTTASAS